MPTKRNKPNNRQKFVYIFFLTVFMAVVAAVGITFFFEVSEIKVTGISIYSADEIISASGIKIGDKLIMLKSDVVSKNLRQTLPYVGAVSVDKKYPDTLVINVIESVGIAAARDIDGRLWMIDKTGRVLEERSSSDGLIEVMGLVLQKNAKDEFPVGEIATVAEADETKFAYMKDVLSAMYLADETGFVSLLDVTDPGGITFVYKETFKVEFGSGENAENKFAIVSSIARKKTDGEKGRIIVINEEDPRFVPET